MIRSNCRIFGFVLALIICLCGSNVSGFRVKLVGLTHSLDSTGWKKISFRPAMLQDACSDRVLMDKKDLFKIVGLKKNPWDRITTKVFSSGTVTNNINNFLTSTGVDGIPGSLQDILQYFATARCYSFPFGGLVRDMFLGNTPKDLDMDVSCSVQIFFNKCVEKWSTDVCSINQKRTIAHVGRRSNNKEQIDASFYEKNFFGDLSGLEYTANSLGFERNANNIVIDVTGTGVDDVCTKKIRIPVDSANWDEWIDNNPSSVVYRYWKLRGKDFEAFDEETKDFIMDKAKTQIMSKLNSFLKFYCYTFIKGIRFSFNKCFVSSLECDDAKLKQKKFNDILLEDLGQVFWDNYLASALNSIVSC